MFANDLATYLVAYWPALLLLAVGATLLNNKFHKGLNKYPGHWLAGYTNWWRFSDVMGRKPEWTHIKLHRKYGDVVRLGPNVLSFADPKALKSIYGLNKGMTKVWIGQDRRPGKDSRLTDLPSPTSIQSSKRQQRVSDCSHCSVQ